jgi:antitoxin ParD1/3/4
MLTVSPETSRADFVYSIGNLGDLLGGVPLCFPSLTNWDLYGKVCQYSLYRGLLMATLNVSLPDAMRAWIDSQIEAGEYANASDYIRDLIRHDQRQRDALRLALIEGEKSGRSTRTVTDIARQTKRRLKRG